MGPSLTFTDPVNVSPSTRVSAAPGKHSATDAMSLTSAQAVSMPTGTVKLCSRSMRSPSGARGLEHRAAGEHRREGPPVVGVAGEVAGRVRALGRPFGSLAYARLGGGDAAEGALGDRRAQRRGAHVGQ